MSLGRRFHPTYLYFSDVPQFSGSRKALKRSSEVSLSTTADETSIRSLVMDLSRIGRERMLRGIRKHSCCFERRTVVASRTSRSLALCTNVMMPRL